ncbi:MAG: MerR family transcriptional regulator [bacterium]
MKDLAIKKLYYSISEVSKITSLKPYVLRYWETEFPELRPSKNRAGNRIYRINDIKIIFLIKKLLYSEKYTIEGARQRLKALRNRESSQLDLSLDDVKVKKENLIHEIRQNLKEIIDILEDHKN